MDSDTWTAIDDRLIQDIKNNTTAEVMTDDRLLGLYSTDASSYQMRPLAVTIPKTEDDLKYIITIANENEIPVLPRGGATSLAGQTVNKALIIDFTKYFNRIIEINLEERWALVQPGVIRDQLNLALKSHKLYFAPDPATTSRATIGGMIANNSSGTRSIKYGKTIDHIIGLKVLLMDGTVMDLHNLSREEYDAKCAQKGREAFTYKAFKKVIEEHKEDIRAAYPKVLRRVQGYPLDEFIDTDDWNLAKVFSGSEGSLGIILEAKIKLEPIPEYKAAFIVHYDDRMKAINEVKHFIDFKPAAVEMLDYNVFELSLKNIQTKKLHDIFIQGSPKATLTVEFNCLSQQELNNCVKSFEEWLRENSTAYAFPLLKTEKEISAATELRKKGLGLIMGDPSGRKPVPFIEDQAIPLEHLVSYVQDVLAICERFKVETVLYAHVSVGVLHIRPGLDLRVQSDIEFMKEISNEVFKLVKKYKGSWSGEHGDGRNRGHRLKDYFGDVVFNCHKSVKNIFDPKHLLNPGIIIDVPPMDKNLRYGAAYKEKKYDYIYKYRKGQSFEGIVNNCSGLGVCRNHNGGTMCPSFKATSDEDASTRGRANALRLAISGQMGFTSVTDPKVLKTLDLCLSCKACKSECPSNVDMAKLKSEVLQKEYEEGNITMRERMISAQVSMGKMMAGRKAPLINTVLKSKPFRWVADKTLGIDKRRTLPLYATETLDTWFSKNYKKKGYEKKVALFADTYINYHELQIGIAAVRLLNQCGYEVELASVGCCQRPRISNGFLKDAKEAGTKVAEKLKPYFEEGMKVVVCEPSCTSAFIDDLPDLLDDTVLAKSLEKNVLALDVFLGQAYKSGKLKGRFKATTHDMLLHGHCHQNSLYGYDDLRYILDNIPELHYHQPDSGCCGMAGAFGYEKEHFDVSKKIAGLVLLPEIKNASEDTVVVTNGFSCRHQIADFSERKALHWVECLEFERVES